MTAAASLPVALPEGARTLRLEPLSAEGFAPFGDLLMSGLGASKAANQGTAKRCDFAAGLESTRREARPNLAVFTSEAQSLPFALRLLDEEKVAVMPGAAFGDAALRLDCVDQAPATAEVAATIWARWSGAEAPARAEGGTS